MSPYLALVPLLWLVAVGIGVLTSDWSRLAHRYPDRASPTLRTYAFRSAIISDGWKFGFSFGAAVVFQPCVAGLRVRLIPPFSFICPSFFVPWNELVFERVPRLHPLASIVFGTPAAGVARVSPRLARKIAAWRAPPTTCRP